MAKKKVTAIVKIQIEAGKASPAPPVGTALGPHGIAIMDFVKAYNAQTEAQAGTVIPVEITIFDDRSFEFVTKTPPTAGAAAREGRPREGCEQPGHARRSDRSPKPTSRRSRRSSCPTSTPTTSRPPSCKCVARRARWVSRSSKPRATATPPGVA